MKDVLTVFQEETNFFSRKLDYISRNEIDEKRIDYYYHVQTNLYTILNILKYKRGDDVSIIKVRFEHYFKTIELEDTDNFIKESCEIENFLKNFD